MLIVLDFDAVQGDGALDGGGGHGQRPGLISGADDDHVGHHVIVKQRFRQADRVEEDIVASQESGD